ncbi:TetR/AcrR family transcriptional regulator [Amycolatopsis cynarae]|uniref:TetR/AcrR family transcriptional regulator n=1 Tax=Amycolatopsis cynarae TaxID=2995223 RepID=A0ABY7BBY0_9PSEU|nr:TetR/AcrR family transcriptional regulator [Amycolatopsis sp. HUAS 11-8]WAL69183.1 TetR/AcrR family transcriptional regulator [Amycolatopsis sp. HUAS 11-8]
MSDQPVPARPGRHRSEASRMAILTAAYELTAELGYAGLTIEGIAARSGAGKQTIYRWWPSKADVLLDALATKADLYVPIPDTGVYRQDLHDFLEASLALGRRQPVIHALRALMAQAQLDEDFGRRFREKFLQRRRDALAVLVERARDRGDLPPSPPAKAIPEIVFGMTWYRLLATREPLDSHLIDTLLGLLAPTGPDERSTP